MYKRSLTQELPEAARAPVAVLHEVPHLLLRPRRRVELLVYYHVVHVRERRGDVEKRLRINSVHG